MASPSVLIIGGGIGGLTAAHELIERGFSVDIYETRPAWGGKARSQMVTGTGTNGRRDLPGEHGFRFYPRFYKHVVDTMARIPSPHGSTVESHLQPTTEAAIAMIDSSGWYRFDRKKIDTPYQLIDVLEIFFQDLEIDAEDAAIFGARFLEFASACDERRLAEYEGKSWWEFLDAAECSPTFQRLLKSIPRMMVAMDPKTGSARTIGSTSLQIMMDFAETGSHNDRTMGGPTTLMWIEPWTTYLAGQGVTFHAGTRVTSLEVAGGKLAGVQLAGGGTATADYYVLAVPIDAAIDLITPALGALDPALDTLRQQSAASLVDWMTGIQYYLYEDVQIVRGHVFYPDSPWALTSISQPQFWRGLGLFRKQFGDGEVGGVLSVDISEWDVPGVLHAKPAKQCTRDEIAAEVWHQLKQAINDPDDQTLTDDLLKAWHLDDDLDYSAGLPPTNSSRLLVHPPGSWAIRPDAGTAVPNLALASDYVRTYTNIATMEGANEGGRRAANAILDRAGYAPADRAQLWPLVEPAELAGMRRFDKWLFDHGHRHIFEILGVRTFVRAAEVARKLEAIVGLTTFEHFLDRFKVTSLIKTILEKLGLPPAS